MQFSAEHLGLAANDPVALKQWYEQVLGARCIWDTGQTPPAFFLELKGGVRIEIYQSQSRVPDTEVNSVAGWRHLALRVPHLEEARDALAARGVTFTEPVKPVVGGGRVLFFRDPERNLLHLVERPAHSIIPAEA